MWQCLATEGEILVHRDHLYFPLLLDPDIQGEVSLLPRPAILAADSAGGPGPGPAGAVLAAGDRLFVQAVRASALVEHYVRVFPRDAARRLQSLREQYSLTADLLGIHLDPRLITIVFHILPHFVRQEGLKTRRLRQEAEVLDFIGESLPAPRAFEKQAQEFLDVNPLKSALRRLSAAPPGPAPLPEGLLPVAGVREWWEETLKARFLAQERARLLQDLQDRERWAATQRGRLATLLYLAHQGSLELEGFGFHRLGRGHDYRIYKRTGSYVLQDFYGRRYLFPDCRVAVSTLERLQPRVVEHYKHPFLRRQGPGQAICLGSQSRPQAFSAQHVIQALEDGLNALLYGYNGRRRNGYHSLDTPPGSVRSVVFDDYRIPHDHPLVVSQRLEMKNRGV
ncbi:MAG: hypothetical protein FJ128_08145 [Deltaproteobacteria bacterium]|nr:hypothetical protein [Deltaproteobacteria bacterium]